MVDAVGKLKGYLNVSSVMVERKLFGKLLYVIGFQSDKLRCLKVEAGIRRCPSLVGHSSPNLFRPGVM
mgnify:CR=1 FL=1